MKGRLRNLGPKSLAMLAAAGIESVAQLNALGAVKMYILVREEWPGASLNLLWALEGALSDQDWREVARHKRLSLLMELEQAEEALGR